MTEPPFPYIGSKRRLASKIVGLLPEHSCYVEPFGGSAAVLLSKRPAETDVYNDLNGHLVTFFKVVRDRPEELQEWLQATPYSRKLHDEYRRKLYGDEEVPNDEIARAGMTFFMQHTTFGGKLNASFKQPAQRNETKRWYDMTSPYRDGINMLTEISDKIASCVIEQLDWRECIRRYDSPSTVFYLDPPYQQSGDVYGFEFSATDLTDALYGINGEWLLSFDADDLDVGHAWKGNETLTWAVDNTSDTKIGSTENLYTSFEPCENIRHENRHTDAMEAEW